jgi:hypothetical protein
MLLVALLFEWGRGTCSRLTPAFETQRAIVAAPMKAGIIEMGEAPQAKAPQPDGGKKRGGWWPFGRKR